MLTKCQSGHIMYVIIGDSVDNQIGVYGLFEESATRVITTLVGSSSAFIDIGCNIGYYSCLFAQQNPSKPVIAIDPNPLMVERTGENLALNKASNTTVLDCGIGAEPGHLELHIPENRHSLASFAYVPQRGGASKSVTAKLTTLSQILADHPLNDVFIKIDTEGYEVNVFKGLKSDHFTNISYILFELTGSNLEQAGHTPDELLTQPVFKEFNLYLITEDSSHPLSEIKNPSFTAEVNVSILMVRKDPLLEKFLSDSGLVHS